MLSTDIKTALLYYCRYKRQWSYVATEVGQYNADVLAANESEIVEFEVKCSIADLKKDFLDKLYKHENYSKADKLADSRIPYGTTGLAYTIPYSRKEICMPNKMYYVVPSKLLKTTENVLADKNDAYGIISYHEEYNSYDGRLEVVKRAKKIHNRPPSQSSLSDIAARSVSELIQMRLRIPKPELEIEDAKPKLPENPGEFDV